MIDWRDFDSEGGSIAIKSVMVMYATKNANGSVDVEVDWGGVMASLWYCFDSSLPNGDEPRNFS